MRLVVPTCTRAGCSGFDVWQRADGGYVCGRCHPRPVARDGVQHVRGERVAISALVRPDEQLLCTECGWSGRARDGYLTWRGPGLRVDCPHRHYIKFAEQAH